MSKGQKKGNRFNDIYKSAMDEMRDDPLQTIAISLEKAKNGRDYKLCRKLVDSVLKGDMEIEPEMRKLMQRFMFSSPNDKSSDGSASIGYQLIKLIKPKQKQENSQ